MFNTRLRKYLVFLIYSHIICLPEHLGTELEENNLLKYIDVSN